MYRNPRSSTADLWVSGVFGAALILASAAAGGTNGREETMFILPAAGAIFLVFLSARHASPLVSGIAGILSPLLTIVPWLLTANYVPSDTNVFILVMTGAFLTIGLVVSTICYSAYGRRRHRTVASERDLPKAWLVRDFYFAAVLVAGLIQLPMKGLLQYARSAQPNWMPIPV